MIRHVEIVDHPVDLASLMYRLPGVPLEDPAGLDSTPIHAGAVQWFLGVTRSVTRVDDDDVHTDDLWYEAHPTMAIKQLHELADQAITRFDLVGLVLVHSIGRVPPGRASVAVGVAGRHRQPMLDAPAWIMDRLKADVPIWKRETFRDGSRDWIHP